MANDITYRVSLQDGEVVRRALMTLGKDGQLALERLERASRPASKGLLAINAVTGQLQGAMAGFSSRLGAVGAGLGALGPAGLVAAAGVVAMTAALAKGIQMARDAIQALSELDNTASKLGVTAEQLQEFRFAAEQTGVSANTLDMAWQRFTRRLGEAQQGTGELVNVLKQYDIAVKNTDGTNRSAVEVYRDLADRVAGVADPQERLRIAFKAFDSEGAALVNLLKQGSDGLDQYAARAREAGLIMDNHLVARAREAGDRIDVLNTKYERNVQEIGLFFTEWLETFHELKAEIAEAINDVLDLFRDDEELSRSGLQSRLDDVAADLDKATDRVARAEASLQSAVDRGSDQAIKRAKARLAQANAAYTKLFEERERLTGLLLDRAAADNQPQTVGTATPSVEKDKAADVIKGLQFQLDQLHRTEFGKKFKSALNSAGLDDPNLTIADERVKKIFDLVLAMQKLKDAKDADAEADKEREQLKKSGEALTKRLRSAEEEYKATLDEISALKAAGAIDAQTEARAVEEAERKKLAASREAADGIKRALSSYADDATNIAKSMEGVTTNALKGMEDAFVKMATTGKLSFRDMANSIIADITRIIVRQQITGPLANILTGWFDGGGGEVLDAGGGPVQVAHGGGMVGAASRTRVASPNLFAGAPRFHVGGFPGLMPGEVPLIAMRGERVMTEAQQANTARTIASLAAVAAAGGKQNVRVEPTVYVNAPGVQARTQTSVKQDGGIQFDVIVEEIENHIWRNVQRGEGGAGTLEGRYGLNPAAGARR